MNRKKLPKAVTRTADEMRAGAAFHGPAETDSFGRQAISLEQSSTTDSSNVIEIAPKPGSTRNAGSQVAGARTSDLVDPSQRQRLAQAIVERHANYSAMGGMVPIPLANVTAVTAIILRMVKLLSNLYGAPYERNRVRAFVIGLVGGTMPTGLSTVAASTFFYVVPGSNLLGLAVSSVAASACTRNIGKLFIDRFENGAAISEFPTLGEH